MSWDVAAALLVLGLVMAIIVFVAIELVLWAIRRIGELPVWVVMAVTVLGSWWLWRN
jgi:hypothetical protein